jgi:arylformamidase
VNRAGSRPLIGEDVWPVERAALDLAYAPSRIAKDAVGTIQAWGERTVVARSALGEAAWLNVPYGRRPTQLLDIYGVALGNADTRRPMHVFLHGGFWQEGSKESAGFAAPAFVAAGWIFVALGYSLAPGASVRAIVREVLAALHVLRAKARYIGGDPNCIVVSGHSAGAQLAASLLAGPASASKDLLRGIAGLVLISGVFELKPVQMSYVNDAAQLTTTEVADLSPARHWPRCDIPVHVAVGSDESAAFKGQSRHLVDAWQPHLKRLTAAEASGRDHFDILWDLADPKADLFQRAIALPGLQSRAAQ